MELKEYFSSTQGTGVLSTADQKGIVNSAVYAAPHSIEDELVCFIMRERKTYANITVNPHACFLFIEKGKFVGKRLYLTKVKEEKNTELLMSLRRHCTSDDCEIDEDLYLVFFSVDKVIPLIGPGEEK